jgi:hypothetical protein
MIAIIESETAEVFGDLIGILVYFADLLNLLSLNIIQASH